MNTSNRTIERVSHPLKMRMLQVKNTTKLSDNMMKVTLTGDDLEGFVTGSPDDHVKIFFPHPGDSTPIVPIITDQGPQMPEGDKKPIMRDYTPTRYDASLKELDVNFVLHGNGPGSKWALNAKTGDTIGVAGPRGSQIIPYGFDWYFMIGDETAIPSFSRRLKELPTDAKAIVIISATSEKAYQELAHNGHAKIQWVYQNNLLETVKAVEFLAGDPFIWVSTEKVVSQTIKHYLFNDKNCKEDWVKATAYWTQS